MPNKKSAKKEFRKGKKNATHNKLIKDTIKDLSKKSNKALVAGETEANAFIAQTMKALDKAAGKKVIKKNTASRKKSRLQKRLNKTTKK